MKLTTRRNAVIHIGVAGTLFCASSAESQVAQPDINNYSDEKAAADWNDEWMDSYRSPLNVLHLSRFKDRMYILEREIGWQPNSDQHGYRTVVVPRGFVTDFASIPRIFWSALSPDGEYTYPAIIHDYNYWEQSIPRETADKILKFGMEDFRVSAEVKHIIYNAVRLGGSMAWDENARLKKSGERRVLKEFPADPTITWADWKKKPNVFL